MNKSKTILIITITLVAIGTIAALIAISILGIRYLNSSEDQENKQTTDGTDSSEKTQEDKQETCSLKYVADSLQEYENKDYLTVDVTTNQNYKYEDDTCSLELTPMITEAVEKYYEEHEFYSKKENVDHSVQDIIYHFYGVETVTRFIVATYSLETIKTGEKDSYKNYSNILTFDLKDSKVEEIVSFETSLSIYTKLIGIDSSTNLIFENTQAPADCIDEDSCAKLNQMIDKLCTDKNLGIFKYNFDTEELKQLEDYCED